MRRPKKVMPWEVYEKAVREFVKAGGGSLNFTPTVGDPLVDKRLIEKIEFANSLPGITGTFLYTVGGRPIRFGAGMNGAISAHSSSVMSLGYRILSRLYWRRVISVQGIVTSILCRNSDGTATH